MAYFAPAMGLRRYTYIERSRDCEVIASQIEAWGFLPIDIESNGFYAYFDKVCLIQISTREADYIIDPLRARDMEWLGRLLRDERILKILHGGDYDIRSFKRDYKYEFSHVFDTMIAARILGIPHLGLAALLKEGFGVDLDKGPQRFNWGTRPLPIKCLRYAQQDTAYLYRLYKQLQKGLKDRNVMDRAEHEFEHLCQVPPIHKIFDPMGYHKIRGVKALNGSRKALIQALYEWRERQAIARDLPPFRLMTNDTLMRLMEVLPVTVEKFRIIKGVPRNFRSEDTLAVLSLIEQHHAAITDSN